MAGRPLKKGLDYSPWIVDVLSGDSDIDRLMEAQGCAGFVIYFYLCQMAYKFEGYYLKWSYTDAVTTAKRVGGGVRSETVIETVGLCLRLGLFDKGLFDRHGILTSRRIQATYEAAIKQSKRLGNAMIAEYRLPEKNFEPGGFPQNAPDGNFHGRNPDLRGGNSGFSGRNSSESKEKKSKENDVPTPPISAEEMQVSAEETQEDTRQHSAVDYYLNRINPTPSEIVLQELMEFVQEMGSDMVIRACQIALDKRIGGNPWKYIKAILVDKKRAGIRTLAQWDESERQRTQRNGGHGPSRPDNSRRGYGSRDAGSMEFHLDDKGGES